MYDTIYYVAESPRDRNVLWTGSDDGLIEVTRDGGNNWKKLTLPGLEDALINQIEVSPHGGAVVYVAATRYKYNDFAPYLFKTSDFGQNWEKMVAGIPAESWTHVVREDPIRKGLLYAGKETGFFCFVQCGTELAASATQFAAHACNGFEGAFWRFAGVHLGAGVLDSGRSGATAASES